MADTRPPPDDDRPVDDESRDGDRRRLFERTVPDVLRKIVERALETGVETLTDGPDNLRRHLGDLKLPKEAAGYVFEQIDDTKKGLYRVVAKEIRDVLEHMSFADELATVLTKLSFEVNTQIRFVPNQATRDDEEPNARSAEGEASATPPPDGDAEPKRKSHFPRPQVVSKVVMKAVDMVTSTMANAAKGGETIPGAPRAPTETKD